MAETRILDFLYLDIERVKSILSQLQGGVVETVLERFRRGAEGKAGTTMFGFLEAGATGSLERATEQGKSLRDYLYIIFEEAAKHEKLLDTAFDPSDVTHWRDPAHRKSLREGQLLKVTAPTRILDSNHFKATIESTLRLPAMVAAVIACQASPSATLSKNKLRDAADAMLGGSHVARQMEIMGDFVQTLFNKQIIMRQFPCGPSNSDLHFLGTLRDDNNYLQESREALVSKYGYHASEWTVVSQVALVPDAFEVGGDEETAREIAPSEAEAFDRDAFEGIITGFLITMQNLGFSTAPRPPAISVTPLAIYHEFTAK
jgi:hypothetical protein